MSRTERRSPEPKSRPAAKPYKRAEAYAPATRLLAVRSMLERAGGVSLADIQTRFEVHRSTAWQYLRALQNKGEAIYEEKIGRSKRWHLEPSARRATVTLTESQMVALFLLRQMTGFLHGTGFETDLSALFEQLEARLKRTDAARHLDRKIFDRNEEAQRYDGRAEDVDDLVTALLREERLSVRHTTVEKGRATFVVEPYTLAIYRKGLYVVGFSHHHQKVRTFGLDGFRAIDRRRGDRFEYPDDYHPAKRFAASLGITEGRSPALVRLRFDEVVVRSVTRRTWHKSQPKRPRKLAGGGIELALRVAPDFELENFAMRFGELAEVLEPAELRTKIAKRAALMAERYAKAAG